MHSVFRKSMGIMALILVCVSGNSGASKQKHRQQAFVAKAAEARHKQSNKRSKMKPFIVYVGTYTGGKSKGIYIFQMDPQTGILTQTGVASGVVNPSFLAVDPNHRYLYAANEIGNYAGTHNGSVTAFSIKRGSGELTQLNQQSSEGNGPCHLSVDRSGKDVLVANYGSGSIAVLPIQAGGRLGPASASIQHTGSSVDPARQEGPHAHSIYVDTSNQYVFSADLGLDKVFIYHFDPSKGTLVPNDPPEFLVAPGSGPRHIAFHPNGPYAYVINEMKSTISACRYDAKQGTLKEMQTISTLPSGYEGANTTAEIVVHPSGKFLYGSNRGQNSIARFAIDAATGQLMYLGSQPTQGKTPRNFAIDPTGTFLLAANQDSDTIVTFRIDPQTGSLTPTGQVTEVPSPVCLTLLSNSH